MRKLHEAYAKKENPWYRRPKVWGIAFAIVLPLGGLAFLGLQKLAEKNKQQTLEYIDQAFDENDLGQAARTVRMALQNDPGNEDLQVQYARLLSRVQPRAAVSLWKQVVEKSDDPEYAVAYVLSAIKVRAYDQAREAIHALQMLEGAESAYHRAGFALAFAEGNDAQAFQHIDTLIELYPENIQYQLEHARIGLNSELEDLKEASQTWLWDHVTTDQGWRNEALKALANGYLDAQDPENLMKILSLARDSEGPGLPENVVWALEAEQRMWGDVDTQTLGEAWNIVTEAGRQGLWLNLMTWMNIHGYAQSAIEWATQRPSAFVWSFPAGFILGESAVLSGVTTQAVEGLSDADWGHRDFMRLLTLSRLTERENGRRFWLDQAYQVADDQAYGGGRLLLPVLQAWNWLDAEVYVTVRVLEQIPVRPSDLSGLLQRLEALNDFQAIYDISRAFIWQFPENPTLLNNAAYFAALLGRDLDDARGWIQKAMELLPNVPQYMSTAAFVYVENRDLMAAETILAQLSEDSARLARLGLSYQRGESIEQELSALKADESLSPVEQSWLRQRITP